EMEPRSWWRADGRGNRISRDVRSEPWKQTTTSASASKRTLSSSGASKGFETSLRRPEFRSGKRISLRSRLPSMRSWRKVSGTSITIWPNTRSSSSKLFGARTKAELLGSVDKIFLPETQEAFAGELIAIAAGQSSFESETVLRTLNGNKL